MHRRCCDLLSRSYFLTAAHAVAAVVAEITIAVADGDRSTVVARRRVCLECGKLLAVILRNDYILNELSLLPRHMFTVRVFPVAV